MKLDIDLKSLDELALIQLPKVIKYCQQQGYISVTKASPHWYGIDHAGNFVQVPHLVYRPNFPGSLA